MTVYSATRWIGLAYAALNVACADIPTAPTSIRTDDAVVLPAPASQLRAVTDATSVSMQELVKRGWECRPSSSIAERILCSAPNQGFPVIAAPPPPDGRAAFTLLAFEDGTFVGTLLLIRADLYQGQRCSSTGEPYEFVESVGYYECFHPAGR